MKIRFAFFRTGLAAAGFLLAAAAAAAQTAPPSDTITVVSTSSGLKTLFDALVPIYAEVGLKAVYQELPAARLNSDAQEGAIDALVAVSDGMAKLIAGHYLMVGKGKAELGVTTLAMYVRAGEEKQFLPDPRLWKGRTIGVINSVNQTVTDAYLKNVDGITIVTAPTYPSLIRMLDSRRFDFFIAPRGAVEADLEALGMQDKVVHQEKALLTLRYWHALNKRYQDKAGPLSEALARHAAQVDAAVNALINR